MTSLPVSPTARLAPLDLVLEHAGGVLVPGDGHAVAAHYGSAAGELAACVRSVGLADCSHLVKLSLAGEPRRLADLLSRLTGEMPAPGGAVFAGGAWWCAPETDRIIVLAEPGSGRRLKTALAAALPRHAAVTLTDRSEAWAALRIVGRRAPVVLDRLGVFGPGGDPRQVAPVTRHPLGGAPALWLLEADDRALALVDGSDAVTAWRTIEQAGRSLGLCAVGRDAVARYALVRRSHSVG